MMDFLHLLPYDPTRQKRENPRQNDLLHFLHLLHTHTSRRPDTASRAHCNKAINAINPSSLLSILSLPMTPGDVPHRPTPRIEGQDHYDHSHVPPSSPLNHHKECNHAT